VVTAVVAIALFWIAWDNGSYGIGERSAIAIVTSWALIVGLGLAVWPLRRLSRTAIAMAILLGCLALWTLASIIWTPDRETTFVEFVRVALFASVFVLVLVASDRSVLGSFLDGMTIAIVATAAVALVSRYFPSSMPDRGLTTFLPGSSTRLSFPLGYWNGLAIFVALGLPLLLRGAANWRHPLVRSAAVAAVPLLASVIYLASSRGGAATALVAGIVMLITARRWAVSAALAAAVVASAITIVVLAAQHELLNGPLDTAAAARQGHLMALATLLVCAATVGVFAVCTRLETRTPPRWAGRALTAGAVLACVGVALAASPGTLVENFKKPPAALASSNGDFIRAHLMSGNGSGRWQFWEAAVDQWRDSPLIGQGAGTYQYWWPAHGSLSYFVRDAHSQYLQTLGELGIIGFALLVGALGLGLVAGVKRTSTEPDVRRRTAIAAPLSLATAWIVAAAIDWMWQLTATTIAAVVAFALVTGPAADRRPLLDAAPERSGRVRGSVLAAAAVAACLVIACSALPWLVDLKIGASRAAAERGDGAAAAADALAARNLQPWASSPYLQLALVSEQTGGLRAARTWIGRAIDRNDQDWRLWLVAARIDVKLGHAAQAQRELRRAIELNPRSPLFQNLRP